MKLSIFFSSMKKIEENPTPIVEPFVESKTLGFENSFELIDSNSYFTIEKKDIALIEETKSERAILEPSTEEAKPLGVDKKIEPKVETVILNKAKVEDGPDERNVSSDDSIKSKPSLGPIRSYATILSEGLTKVRNVFKPKPKDESRERETIKVITLSDPEEKPMAYVSNKQPIIQKEIIPNSETLDIQLGIPGLIFKQDLERRNSKKKRRSRVMEETQDVSNASPEPKRKPCLQESEEIQKTVVPADDFEEIHLESVQENLIIENRVGTINSCELTQFGAQIKIINNQY